MEESGKTLFITGSSGFIGKNAVQYFQDRYDIIAPKHKELDLLNQNDVKLFFENNDIDYVIHCANVGGTRKDRDVNGVLDKNLRMFFNIAENQHRFKRMIHFGSGAEYNKNQALKMVKENNFRKDIPADEYGLSKYIISNYIEISQNIYCLRLFGVFGRYEDYEFKFISNAIVKNLLHLPLRIQQNVFFDWLYIDDLLHILDYFLEKNPAYRIYNITSGTIMDLVSICKMINELSNFKSEIIVENGGLNLEYSGDNQRLLEEIGHFHFKSMEESIKDLSMHYGNLLPKINAKAIQEDKHAAYCKIK